jgi:hypothetical protein
MIEEPGSRAGSGSILTSDQWIRIRIREAQKHVDPDPQHCQKQVLKYPRNRYLLKYPETGIKIPRNRY